MYTKTEFDRRQFLAFAGAGGAALIAAHFSFGIPMETPMVDRTGARIAKLDLLSSAPTHEMREFYGSVLGLSIAKVERKSVTVAVGDSMLTFRESSAEQDRPFYHFAFNIPENKIRSALEWQRLRTPLLPIPEPMRDPEYPAEVVNYTQWNAHSVFFLDPAGNVVEYIARHDLKNPAPGNFSSSDILYPSEIGIIVDDVIATAAALKEVAGLNQYRGGSEQFMALGDEHGLLLIMKRGRILNFNPATQDKAARIFPTGIHARGPKSVQYMPENLPYRVVFDSDKS
ncbi:MAG TPA: hypothetical protein VGI45_00565 [Terracidiphilus sp.]|jgi:catechol-2,3-dioxygenase